MRATTTAVVDAINRRLRADYIAKILVGERGPVIEALVQQNGLDLYFGSCFGVDLNPLTSLVRDLRLSGRPAQKRVRAPSTPPSPSPEDPSPEQLRELVNGITRRTGRLSFWMYAHILYGSEGPVVQALVLEHELQEYGVFRKVGFGRLKLLLRDILQAPDTFTNQAAFSRPDATPGKRVTPDDQADAQMPKDSEETTPLPRLVDRGNQLPTASEMQQLLEWRASDRNAKSDADVDRWLRIHRGYAAASWFYLVDDHAGRAADPCELGAMCCQLASSLQTRLTWKGRLSEFQRLYSAAKVRVLST